MQSYNFSGKKRKKIEFSFPSFTFKNRSIKGPTRRPLRRTVANSRADTKQESYYIRIILRSLIAYVAIGIASFFIFIAIFSNINSLWGFFRPTEVYKEKEFGPSKPYLSTETEATKESTITLSGTAQGGSKVVLYKNSDYSEETIADSGNKFEFTEVAIKNENDAVTKFYVEVEDSKGNKSPQSNAVLVIYDDKKPDLYVSDPTPDQRIKDYNRSYEVKGKSEPGAKVTVNEKIARVSPEGDFSVTIRLDDEVNILKVLSVDEAGNETKIEVPVYFEKRG